MNNTPNKKERGVISILGLAILGFLIVLALGYFKINLRTLISDQKDKYNASYVQNTSRSVWDDYLKEPVDYVWNKIIKDIFLKSFVENINRLKNGQPPTIIEGSGPGLKI